MAKSAPQARQTTHDKFQQLADQAKTARETNHTKEAIVLYRRALEIQPDWPEGWWYVADLSYAEGQYGDCRRGFTRFLQLQPQSAPAYALRSICSYYQNLFQQTIQDAERARKLQLERVNQDLYRTSEYFAALAMIRVGRFGSAIDTLKYFALKGIESQDLTLAMGLAMLRIPLAPAELNTSRKEMVMTAGRAALAAAQGKRDEARSEYAQLLAAYPTTPNVHYAYGLFLYLSGDLPGAVRAFEKEIGVSPGSVVARIEIAFLCQKTGCISEGLHDAEEAARLDPTSYTAHYALGELLLRTGKVDPAIKYLEIAEKLSPKIAEIHYALLLAYSRADRREDAKRQQAIFQKLKLAHVNREKGENLSFMASKSSQVMESDR